MKILTSCRSRIITAVILGLVTSLIIFKTTEKPAIYDYDTMPCALDNINLYIEESNFIDKTGFPFIAEKLNYTSGNCTLGSTEVIEPSIVDSYNLWAFTTVYGLIDAALYCSVWYGLLTLISKRHANTRD